jgi:ABC-2 type transport system ATP-binding protein
MTTDPANDGAAAIEFVRVSKGFQLREGRTLTEFVPALISGNGWHPPFYALSDVSFHVPRGETLGIIGRNGTGKSTILKLIAGVMAPTTGDVLVRGRVSPLIELAVGFHPDLTGRENVFLNASILGMTNRDIRAHLPAIIEFAELGDFMDTPVKRYSSGMYVRLGFSVAVHSSPDILLIDEALAVGDAGFQAKCLGRIEEFQKQGVTIVLVSHALDWIKKLCGRTILMENGRLIDEGDPTDVVAHYLELHPGLVRSR